MRGARQAYRDVTRLTDENASLKDQRDQALKDLGVAHQERDAARAAAHPTAADRVLDKTVEAAPAAMAGAVAMVGSRMEWGVGTLLPALTHAVYSAPDLPRAVLACLMFAYLFTYSTGLTMYGKLHDGAYALTPRTPSPRRLAAARLHALALSEFVLSLCVRAQTSTSSHVR